MKRKPEKKSKPIPQVTPTKKPASGLVYAFVLSLLAFLLYSNTLGHKFVMDDFAAITGNKFVQNGVESLSDILTTSYWFGMNENTGGIYRPISLIMFAIEWEFFPGNPLPGHLMNVLLYSLTGFILFFFLRRIALEQNLLFAFLAGLLWILHPLHAEVVANIKSRDEILSFLFGIVVLIQALKYVDSNKKIHLAGMILFYLLALFSKENAICLIFILPVTIYFFSRAEKRHHVTILTFAVICTVVFLIVRASVLGSIYQDTIIPVNDNSMAGAKSFNDRFGTAIFILGYYLYKFFVPLSFSSDYSYNQIALKPLSNPYTLISLLAFIGLTYYVIRHFKRKDQIAYGILFFIISIGLVSNIIFLLGSTMGERFMYMPSLGICIAFMALLFKLFKVQTGLEQDRRISWVQSKTLLFTLLPVFLFLSFKTYTRNQDWKNDLSLFSKDVKTASENVKMKFFYARSVMEQIKYNRLAPGQKVSIDDAEKELKNALKIDSNYYLIYNTLAEIYNYKKNYPAAIDLLRKTISKHPENADACGNLGNIYFRIQRFDSALYFQKLAVSKVPNSYLNYHNLGGAQFQMQLYEDAVKSYQKSIQLHPGYIDAYKNLGTVYSVLKNYDEAIANYNKALSMDPNNTVILNYLGIVYEQKGDISKANLYKEKAKAITSSAK